jgi:hypothetical protein
MSIQRLSLRNFDAPVRNPGLRDPVATGGRPQPQQLGLSSRFRDTFAGGTRPQRPTLPTRPTAPQTEPNGSPQKKNVDDFMKRIQDLFGERLTKGLTRLMKMLSMSTSKPILPPPNSFAGEL